MAGKPIALPDAELTLHEHLPLKDEEALLALLIEQTHWQQETISLFGKTHLQPRLIAWYGEREAHYRYSGTDHPPLPWTPPLNALRALIEDTCGKRFNSVLLNYYRDQNDSMGLHADDEPELGPQPVIASLSLGAERKLYFRHKTRREFPTFDLPLSSGSLLVMAGTTQDYWKHGLRKLSRPCGARINLTFRNILPRHAPE